jgi:hypothetical protein
LGQYGAHPSSLLDYRSCCCSDKLGVVTTALFNQKDFTETAILDDFGSSLEQSLRTQLTESNLFMGTNLRELVHTFRQRTLILVKAMMLQKRVRVPSMSNRT